MLDFLVAFGLLLVPVLILLIVRLQRRRTMRFPHTYLRPFRDERLRDLLLRTFQLYHDVALDVVAAALLALVLSGLFGRLASPPPAVCLDGSWSMLRGPGQSPLDRALRLVLEDRLPVRDYRLYLAGFDPRRGHSRLFPLSVRELRRLGGVAEARRHLVERHPFLLADAGDLLSLARAGPRRVIWLTDHPVGASVPFEVIAVGAAGPQPFYYPLSVSYDVASGLHRLLVLRQGFAEALGVERFDAGGYAPRSVREKALPSRAGALSVIELVEPGLYRLRGGNVSFVLELVDPRLTVTVRGAYSRLLLEVLPQLREGEAGPLLADLPLRSAEPEELRRLPRRIRAVRVARAPSGAPARLITLVASGEETDGGPGADAGRVPLVYPLEDSFSRLCYTEVPPGLPGPAEELFFLDPEGPLDADTPLVYLQRLWRAREGRSAAASGRLDPARGGATSFVYWTRRSAALRVVNLPPEEFFPLPAEDSAVASAEATAPGPMTRLLPFLLLLALYLLKLAFLRKLRGRGPSARGETVLAKP